MALEYQKEKQRKWNMYANYAENGRFPETGQPSGFVLQRELEARLNEMDLSKMRPRRRSVLKGKAVVGSDNSTRQEAVNVEEETEIKNDPLDVSGSKRAAESLQSLRGKKSKQMAKMATPPCKKNVTFEEASPLRSEPLQKMIGTQIGSDSDEDWVEDSDSVYEKRKEATNSRSYRIESADMVPIEVTSESLRVSPDEASSKATAETVLQEEVSVKVKKN